MLPAPHVFRLRFRVSAIVALALITAPGVARADCPPGPPVSASDGLCGVIQVVWNPVQGAVGYDIVRNTINSLSGGTEIATVHPFNFFTDANVSPQETYYYFVRVRVTPSPFGCLVGFGTWGPGDSGWSAGAPPSLVFDPGQDVDASGCAPVISFTAINRGTVQLYRNVPPSVDFADAVLIASWTTQQAPQGFSFTDTGAPAGQSTYWFRRHNACGSLVNPPFVVQRPFVAAPDAPSDFAATSGSVCDAIVLTWHAVSGAQFYTVDMFLTPEQVVPSESFQVIAEPVPTSGIYTDVYQDPTNGGNQGPQRYFRIRAGNPCGQSPAANAQGYAGGNPILGAPACVVVGLGDPVTLSCPTGLASAFQWLRDGVPLTDDGRVTGSLTPTLHISSASAADVGEYVLRATGVCGVVHSASGVLAVRTTGSCAADFDGNGTRDVTDIFAFLAAWFAGCP
jgi:hypothetical protein